MKTFALAAALICATGCVPHSPLPTYSSLSKENAKECVDHCTTLGMKLASVVIMRNSVGCVCEPNGATHSAGGGAAAAMGAIMAQQEEEEEQQQQRQE